MEDTNFQLVAFQLGREVYGIDIMHVHSIVNAEGIRSIPQAPHFVEGIYNLRGEIIPVINLHQRFNIPEIEKDEDDENLINGMMIIEVLGSKLGLIIDDVSRVVSADIEKIQPSPLNLTGINREYVTGIYNNDGLYLVILDVNKLFDPKELKLLKMLRG